MRLRSLPFALLTLFPVRVFAASPELDPSSDSTEVQEAVVEVAVGSMARRTLMVLEENGELLLPAVEFFDLIELHVSVDSAGRLSGVRYPEGIPIFLDPAGRTASAGDVNWTTAPNQTIWRGGTLYVAVPVLADLLDIRFHMDWAELRLTIMNPESLPIARRLARERARQAGRGLYALQPDRTLGLQRPRWDGAVFDWGIYYPGGSPADRTSFRAGLGMNVLGGSLELRHDGLNQPGGRASASWLGVWPESRWLKQVGLGDVTGSGPRPGRIRGVFATNSPYIRPSFFDRDLLGGELPPGWEVEVYQNGRLIDYTEAGLDGRYLLDTPLNYGPNPLELRAYGPAGQVQIWERTVPIQRDRLPEGVFEYGAAAGECWDRRCRTAGNLDLRYGISRAWTVRAGLEAFGRDTLPNLFQPYGSIFGTVDSRWVVQAAVLGNGFVGGDLIYAPSPDLRVGGRVAWYDTDVAKPILTPDGRSRELRAFAFWRPNPRYRSFFLEASAIRIDGTLSEHSTVRLGGSYQTGWVRWMGGLRREATATGGGTIGRTIADLTASANLRAPAIAALDRLFVRTGVEFSRRGFERVEWTASRPMFGSNRLDARISWVRGTREPFISLGITAFLDGARTITGFSRTPASPVHVSAIAEGSVIWNGTAGEVNVSPERSLRRGGLGGLVFLDVNGNGRFDGFDDPLSDVRVQVGPYTLVTDENGRFAIWDLVPFVETDIAVDTMSLNSPLWVPTFTLTNVTVGPNMVRHLDVPILPAAEVTGRVVLRTASGPRPLPGLRFELVSRETGRRYEAVTFHDGEFYVLGLPPGRYEVSIPWKTREALTLSEPLSRFRVTLEDGFAAAPFVEIELTPQND